MVGEGQPGGEAHWALLEITVGTKAGTRVCFTEASLGSPLSLVLLWNALTY